MTDKSDFFFFFFFFGGSVPRLTVGGTNNASYNKINKRLAVK